MQKKVLIAISGGVDSAAAAVLLRDAGMDVTGVYFCLSTRLTCKTHQRSCCSPQDVADAERIAVRLGIDFTVVDATDDFERIKEEFANSYSLGRTPNPCILCNKYIKFGKMVELADSIGAYYIATGHYAAIINEDGRKFIGKAKAVKKDQSYVLFNIEPSLLGRIIFPLGGIADKESTRDIVRIAGLTVYDKPESQDICFVPGGDYRSILHGRADDAMMPGDVLDSAGRHLGMHGGYGLFTIGQRKGVGIASTQPLYVNTINPVNRTIIIGPREELGVLGLVASSINSFTDLPENFRCGVKIRYNDFGKSASVRYIGDDTLEVLFDQPVYAVAPGQAVVFYEGDKIIAGGWIDRSIKN